MRRHVHFLLFPIVLKILALSQKCVQPSTEYDLPAAHSHHHDFLIMPVTGS